MELAANNVATEPPKFWLVERFTPQQTTILKLLHANYPDDVANKKIVHELYWEDPNGGPLEAMKVVRNRIFYARKQLKGSGWKITNLYGSYRLEQAHAA